MADPEKISETNADTPAADQVKRGSALLPALKIGGFITVVLVAECLVALLLLPSAADVRAMAEARLGTAVEAAPDPLEEVQKTDEEPTVEVDLEQYSVTAFQPLSNTTIRIDFQLFGTVLEKDQSMFEQQFMATKHRIREQVIVTLRSSEITDLTDASLALVKRKILDKTNRQLGKPLLKSVVFSDFSFVEQ